MDKSFYGLDGYEPWEVCETVESIIEVLLKTYLLYANGEVKPPDKIKEAISLKWSGHERNMIEDIVYNLNKFREKVNS